MTNTKWEKHKHHGVAMRHVVRKLLQVIQAMAQTGLPFDASKIGANNVWLYIACLSENRSRHEGKRF